CSVLFLPLPVYCAVAVRLDGAAGRAGGGVVTVSDALPGSVAPVFDPLVALALTVYEPKAVEGGVLVSVAAPVAPGPNVSEAGEKLDFQVASLGSEDARPNVREAHAIESLFFTDTVKLNGDPALTEALN